MSREAMQMALEALENIGDEWGFTSKRTLPKRFEAITALRKALETEQEPVLWLKTWPDGSVTVLKTKSHAFADHELEPLYTAPPKREWVGLTLNEAEDFYDKYTDRAELINAVDKFLEEKNRG